MPSTYLITEHADAAGRRHLIRSEPDGRYLGRQRQDKHLRGGHYRLADEAHPEQVRADGETLDPGTDTRTEHTADGSNS